MRSGTRPGSGVGRRAVAGDRHTDTTHGPDPAGGFLGAGSAHHAGARPAAVHLADRRLVLCLRGAAGAYGWNVPWPPRRVPDRPHPGHEATRLRRGDAQGNGIDACGGGPFVGDRAATSVVATLLMRGVLDVPVSAPRRPASGAMPPPATSPPAPLLPHWWPPDCARVGAPSAGSGTQEEAVTVGEVAGQAVVADQQGRWVAGVGPGQHPVAVVRLLDTGEDHGGHGDLGDVHDRFVEPVDDPAGGSCRAQA